MAHAHSLPPIPRALTHAPGMIRFSDPLLRRLLHAGVPLGPNQVVVMRGRTSGKVYEVPLAIMEFRGHRYVMGTFGEVNWVRNLRAAGEAEIHVAGGPPEPVRAVELTGEDGVAFYRDTFAEYTHAMSAFMRLFARIFLGLFAPEMLSDANLAAAKHPVFELLPTDSSAVPAA